MAYPKRGEVYLVSLDPTLGKEIKKTRPAVVVQNDVFNQYSPLVIICPITSTLREGITMVIVEAGQSGLDHKSVVLAQQIRCVDKKRLVKKLGRLDEETLAEVDVALKVVVGLLPI